MAREGVMAPRAACVCCGAVPYGCAVAVCCVGVLCLCGWSACNGA